MLALVLVVLLAGGDDETKTGIERGVLSAFSTDTKVVTKSVGTNLTPQAAMESADAQKDASVAWIEWNAAESRAVVHVKRGSQWVDRTIGFAPADAPGERGRTIGYAVASMLDVPPPETHDKPIAEPRDSTPTSPPPRRFWGLIDLGPRASAGFGGDGSGFGAGLAGHLLLSPNVGIRIGTSIEGGEVDAAHASSLTVDGGLGLALMVRPGSAPFELGARVDALFIVQSLNHFSGDDVTPVRGSRVLPGADLFASGVWFFAQNAGLFLEVGTTVAFGSTEVIVAGNKVATLAPVRGTLGLGIRLRF